MPSYLVEIWRKNGKPSYQDATNPYQDVLEELKEVDDDRSAITFWLPKSKDRREEMARAFEEIAAIFRTSLSGSGLD